MRAVAGLLLLLLTSSLLAASLPGGAGVAVLAAGHPFGRAQHLWKALDSAPHPRDGALEGGGVVLTAGLQDSLQRFLAEMA